MGWEVCMLWKEADQELLRWLLPSTCGSTLSRTLLARALAVAVVGSREASPTQRRREGMRLFTLIFPMLPYTFQAAAGGSRKRSRGSSCGGARVRPDFAAIRASVEAAQTAIAAARMEQRQAAAAAAADAEGGRLAAAAVSRDEDEAEFRAKEARRMVKDIGRLNPIVLAGGGWRRAGEEAAAGGAVGSTNVPHQEAGGSTAVPHQGPADGSGHLPLTSRPAAPPPPVPHPLHPGFESVGGLGGAVRTLREMVLLPLLYPELLAGMGAAPPG